MMKRLYVILLLIKVIGVVTQENPCHPQTFPRMIFFNETSKKGDIIFFGNVTHSSTQKWNITERNPRVSLQFINNTYQIRLLRPVDLDVINLDDACHHGLNIFGQNATCEDNYGRSVTIRYTLRFFVKPVNEYPPIAVRNDTIRIQEGEGPTPIYIARMFDFFQDRDCPRDRPIFIISKTTEKADASEYFTVNTTSGFLYQIKNFDYEDTGIQCGLGKTGGILNVTAKYGSYTMSTILNVNFTDVDDTPPVFVRDDCSTTCYSCPVPAIFVTIDYFDQGIIKTEPSHLKAIDTDSPRSKITYNLTAYPERYIDNIAFENGTFILSQSFANFSNSSESSDFRVVVVLQAFGSNGQKSEPFVLIMHVTLPPTTTKDTTTIEMGILLTTKEGAFDHPMLGESKSDSTKDIAIIVLSISTGLLLIVVIAFIFYKRWSTRTKQESPSTGYEEVKTDNNHQENVYATITL